MVDKKLVWIGATIGSVIGGYIPALWGDSSLFSPVSMLLGGAGAIIGIVAAYKISRNYS